MYLHGATILCIFGKQQVLTWIEKTKAKMYPQPTIALAPMDMIMALGADKSAPFVSSLMWLHWDPLLLIGSQWHCVVNKLAAIHSLGLWPALGRHSIHVTSRIAFLVYTYLHASKPAPPDQVSTRPNMRGNRSDPCDPMCAQALCLQQTARLAAATCDGELRHEHSDEEQIPAQVQSVKT